MSSSSATSSSNKSSLAAALRHVLENRKASDVIEAAKSNTVVEVHTDMKPVQAAQVLWDNNILGAPCWDSVNQKYVGFFDMRDILSAVVASHKEKVLEERLSAAAIAAARATNVDVMTQWFGHMNVSTSYLAARNPFVSCKADTSLQDVCRSLVDTRCHRIPVVNDEGRCVGIISQSALVKFLVSQVPTDDAIDKETLKDSKLPYLKEVVKAEDTMAASDVFEMLDAHRLSGIAVVDAEDGHLVGNTSARDIKLAVLDQGNINMAQMDILSYLAAVRQATPTRKERYPSAHVNETTSTVGHAIRMLAKTGYHRVFVVDEQTKPIGVISVADVIRFVVEENK